MKLEMLLPSLRLACSIALANHQVGKLTGNSALAVAFHADDTPEIFYVADVEGFKVPPPYVYAASLLVRSLGTITDTIAGLGLAHEQSVERMASVLLTNVSKLIFDTQTTEPRMIALANVLDGFAQAGIMSGLAAAAKPPQPPSLKCTAPERN
ncbi:MAG: hypothetical protein ABSH48_16830 [Verrucomicrobiota bacterium]